MTWREFFLNLGTRAAMTWLAADFVELHSPGNGGLLWLLWIAWSVIDLACVLGIAEERP